MSVFGFCGCEFGILGWIKTAKEKKEAKEANVTKVAMENQTKLEQNIEKE